MTTLNEQIVETRTELEELEQRPARLAAKLAALEAERDAATAKRVQALRHYRRQVEPAQNAQLAALVARRTELRKKYVEMAATLSELIEGIRLYEAVAIATAKNVIEQQRVAAQLAGERYAAGQAADVYNQLSFGATDEAMLALLSLVNSKNLVSNVHQISFFIAGRLANVRANDAMQNRPPTDKFLNEWGDTTNEDSHPLETTPD